MTRLESQQRKNRFIFTMVFAIVCIIISFCTGYRLGTVVERQEWMEIVNEAIVEERTSALSI